MKASAQYEKTVNGALAYIVVVFKENKYKF